MNAVLLRLLHDRDGNAFYPSPQELFDYEINGLEVAAEDSHESVEHLIPREFLKKEVVNTPVQHIIASLDSRNRVIHVELRTAEAIAKSQLRTEDESEVLKLHGLEHSASLSECPSPPLNAEYILHLLLRADERDAVIGDLLERYVTKHQRFGERRAQIWFYSEVVRSLWPLVKRVIARVGGLLAFGEWIRRHVW